MLQPGIGINERGKRREAWKRWERDTGWEVATGKCLVRSLCIVVVQEAGGDLTHLLKCLGTMHLDALLVKRSMVSFDKGVLVGSMRRTDVRLDPQTQQKAHERRRKIAPGGSTNETRIAIKGDLGR